jgi:23S rRNA pseudouridine1911/1915/1917 synthase
MKKKPTKKQRSETLYRVAPSQAHQTLTTALREWLPENPSWGQLRRLVGTRRVLVNGNVCVDAARRLKLTDVVRVLEHPGAPPAREDDVRIAYLDSQIVVVEKPSGMTSVRHALEKQWPTKRKEEQPTLEDLLPRIIAKKQGGGRGVQQRGGERRGARGANPPSRTPPVRPVHRLDRETSGVMIFARTVPAERRLGEQFRKHTTERRYLAIVEGAIAAQRIESQLVRDRGDGRRGSTEMEGVGKTAVTHVRPLESFDGCTLVECRLETGRTHQIRIQLSELGHPVCGDKVYGRAKSDEGQRIGAPRLALHAESLTFEHPHSGEQMTFRMPLPADLKQFLDRLRHKKMPPT